MVIARTETPSLLSQIWTEADLSEALKIPYTKATGASRILGNWTTLGLPFILLSGKRFYIESDVLEWFKSKTVSETQSTES